LAAAGWCRAAESPANSIEAVVHDSPITYYELQTLNRQSAPELQRQYGKDPAAFAQKAAEVRTNNLEFLISRQLILREFENAGYNVPEAVFEDVINDSIRKDFGDRRTAIKTLEMRGSNLEKYRREVRERFIIQIMTDKNVAQEILISPTKVQNYYDAHREDYKVKEQVKFRMIVVPEVEGRGKAFAQDILNQIKAGAAFEDMANLYSQGAPRKDGGDQGWRELSTLRKEIAQAAAPLRAGERSEIIETPGTFFLIQVDDRKDEHYRPLSEVRDEIERTLTLEERARLQKQWVARLKKKTFHAYR
jgi:parvulin-like peptidyl-prolyl isomerase